MGRLAEQQARWIFQQLIIGLDYCHSRVSISIVLPATSLLCLVLQPGKAFLCEGTVSWAVVV